MKYPDGPIIDWESIRKEIDEEFPKKIREAAREKLIEIANKPDFTSFIVEEEDEDDGKDRPSRTKR